jgi:hypothetical protein
MIDGEPRNKDEALNAFYKHMEGDGHAPGFDDRATELMNKADELGANDADWLDRDLGKSPPERRQQIFQESVGSFLIADEDGDIENPNEVTRQIAGVKQKYGLHW